MRSIPRITLHILQCKFPLPLPLMYKSPDSLTLRAHLNSTTCQALIIFFAGYIAKIDISVRFLDLNVEEEQMFNFH